MSDSRDPRPPPLTEPDPTPLSPPPRSPRAKGILSKPGMVGVFLIALAASFVVPQAILIEHIYATDGLAPVVVPPGNWTVLQDIQVHVQGDDVLRFNESHGWGAMFLLWWSNATSFGFNVSNSQANGIGGRGINSPTVAFYDGSFSCESSPLVALVPGPYWVTYDLQGSNAHIRVLAD